MTIREILEVFDADITASKKALKRMEAARARILACTRSAEDNDGETLKLCQPDQSETVDRPGMRKAA